MAMVATVVEDISRMQSGEITGEQAITAIAEANQVVELLRAAGKTDEADELSTIVWEVESVAVLAHATDRVTAAAANLPLGEIPGLHSSILADAALWVERGHTELSQALDGLALQLVAVARERFERSASTASNSSRKPVTLEGRSTR